MDVLVIDDSALVRSEMTELVGSIPGARVVATAIDGVDGYSQALRHAPDVILLDLEMPGMDGFTLLRLLSPVMDTPVIVVTGFRWHNNAKRALSLGAFDFIEKPKEGAGLKPLKCEIERKLKLLPFVRPGPRASAHPARGAFVSERTPCEAVVIGASTGGPRAVSAVVGALPAEFEAAVGVSIHMPGWVTGPFVKRLAAESAARVMTATDGTVVRGGTVLVAPGGYHLCFEKKDGRVLTVLEKKAPRDLYSPSVDRMFGSAAEAWGAGLVGVVMTGMGSDGMRGTLEVKARGGCVLAESRASAEVFGMPGAAISTGKVDRVMSTRAIGAWLSRRLSGSELKLA